MQTRGRYLHLHDPRERTLEPEPKWSPRTCLLIHVGVILGSWAIVILLFIGAFRLADWWMA